LNIIAESFAAALQGAYHPRIEYPKAEAETPADEDTLVPE
jgi:membrane-associated HD superfamily phosphohydrolase